MTFGNSVVTVTDVLPDADPFEALGDPQRRAILQLLSRGDLAVQQIADELPISRPAGVGRTGPV